MYSTKKIPAPFLEKAKEPIPTPAPLPIAAKEKTAPPVQRGKSAASPLAALLLLELFSQ